MPRGSGWKLELFVTTNLLTVPVAGGVAGLACIANSCFSIRLKATPAETVNGEVPSALTDSTVSGAVEVVPGIRSTLVSVIAVVFVLEKANPQSAGGAVKENGLGFSSSVLPLSFAVL